MNLFRNVLPVILGLVIVLLLILGQRKERALSDVQSRYADLSERARVDSVARRNLEREADSLLILVNRASTRAEELQASARALRAQIDSLEFKDAGRAALALDWDAELRDGRVCLDESSFQDALYYRMSAGLSDSLAELRGTQLDWCLAAQTRSDSARANAVRSLASFRGFADSVTRAHILLQEKHAAAKRERYYWGVAGLVIGAGVVKLLAK